MNNNTLDKVTNWTKPDGSIVTTYYVRKAMREGETEDQFIARVNEKLMKERPDFKNMPFTLDKASEMPDMSLRHKLRRGRDGKLFIDYSIKSQQEQLEEKQIAKESIRDSLRKKLLDSVPNLSIEEVNLLLGKES